MPCIRDTCGLQGALRHRRCYPFSALVDASDKSLQAAATPQTTILFDAREAAA